MVGELWVELSLLASLVTGTTALVLCFLAWDILGESAVGQAVAILTVVMGLFSVYHSIALLVPDSALLTSVLKSVTFTGVVLFVALLIRVDRAVDEDPSNPSEY